jgi:hypothetical protein
METIKAIPRIKEALDWIAADLGQHTRLYLARLPGSASLSCFSRS